MSLINVRAYRSSWMPLLNVRGSSYPHTKVYVYVKKTKTISL